MIDNICFQIENYSIGDYKGMNLTDGASEVLSSGEIIKWDWHNLRCSYNRSSRLLWVKNSLHKFYNSHVENLGEFNHDDFTYEKVAAAINALTEAFGLPISDMNLLGRFEYGVNIDVGSTRPYPEIIERYQSITTTASNPFYAFYNKTEKPYAKFCQFTNYTVKAYDKGRQLCIPNRNILRFEVANHNRGQTRLVLKKEHPTCQDLLDKNCWDSLCAKLLFAYDGIRVLGDPKSVSASEYLQLAIFSTPIMHKDLGERVTADYAKINALHDRVKNAPESLHGRVRSSIIKICAGLLQTQELTPL